MEPKSIGPESPRECTIIRRLNRFVVEIEVDGSLERACINNTGRLNDYLFKGNIGFCTRNRHELKTAYRLIAIKEGNFAAIIDTWWQMKAFEELLEMGLIPWLEGFVILKRNARLGNSVIDYLLARGRKQIYLEIKSAVLREGGYAMYPDCPSVRGRRHIKTLIDHRATGGAAAILFMAALPDVELFKPNKAGDPKLGDLLVEAHNLGVNIRAVSFYYNPHDFSVYLGHHDLPVEL